MKRSLLGSRALALTLGGALLGAAAWWFTQNFAFVEEDEYVGYSGEARVNPYYAARLLLERMGRRVQQKVDLWQPQPLAEGATMILTAGHDQLDPPTIDAVLAWVERGAHLVIGVESADGQDALLAAIQVRAQAPTDAADAPHPQHCAPDEDATAFEQIVLDDGRTLRGRLDQGPILIDPQDSSLWRHDSGEGARILALTWGEGRITVFGTLRPFRNRHLGEFDHARLLWHVVAPARAPELYLVRYLDTVSLPRWLLQHAPLALIATVLCMALWLWRVMLRFGPLAPSAMLDRRSLLEHLRAVGRYYGGARQQTRLLVLLREDCMALFARHAPLAHGLEGAAQLREASRLTRINPRELLDAFSGAAASRNDFFHMVRTLARFRHRLTRRS